MCVALPAGWVVSIAILYRRVGGERDIAARATDSMIERFGRLMIIVLVELAVGVGGGIADTDRSPIAIATVMTGRHYERASRALWASTHSASMRRRRFLERFVRITHRTSSSVEPIQRSIRCWPMAASAATATLQQ